MDSTRAATSCGRDSMATRRRAPGYDGPGLLTIRQRLVGRDGFEPRRDVLRARCRANAPQRAWTPMFGLLKMMREIGGACSQKRTLLRQKFPNSGKISGTFR